MPESNLGIDFAEIVAQVAYLLHGVRGVDLLDKDDQDNVYACVKSGLRNFYFPTAVDPNLIHSWSFLVPRFSLAVETGKDSIELPGDWGGIEGTMQFSNDDNVFGEVRKISVAGILELRGAPTVTEGQPAAFAEVAKRTAGTQVQRWELLLWPVPDSTYTLMGQYRVTPNALGEIASQPYGGVEHAETVLEACLAAAERKLTRDPGGPHQLSFKERLLASIRMDQEHHAPDFLGYNGDKSVRRRAVRRFVDNGVTVSGVEFTS